MLSRMYQVTCHRSSSLHILILTLPTLGLPPCPPGPRDPHPTEPGPAPAAAPWGAQGMGMPGRHQCPDPGELSPRG